MSFLNAPNDANTYLPPVIQIPSALSIEAITQTYPMVVTATANSDQSNTYVPGQAVRLSVPVTYQMWQANGLVGVITAVDGDDISLNIDARNFDAFVVPAAGQLQPATLAPFGSRNLQFSNTTNQVPYQSLNNIGN